MKQIRNLIYALFAGCFGGLLLPPVLKIPSVSGAANVLKWIASAMATPGAFAAALSNGFKIHDIDFAIVDFGNFVFYSVATYFTLFIRGGSRAKTQEKITPIVQPGKT
jgi:hypothetical protein